MLKLRMDLNKSIAKILKRGIFMVEMRIIETLSEYQMIKEQAKFSLFLFGSESCAPCKALKEKIMLWSSSHTQVLTNYVSKIIIFNLQHRKISLDHQQYLFLLKEKKQYEKLDILALKKCLLRWIDIYHIVIKVSP